MAAYDVDELLSKCGGANAAIRRLREAALSLVLVEELLQLLGLANSELTYECVSDFASLCCRLPFTFDAARV